MQHFYSKTCKDQRNTNDLKSQHYWVKSYVYWDIRNSFKTWVDRFEGGNIWPFHGTGATCSIYLCGRAHIYLLLVWTLYVSVCVCVCARRLQCYSMSDTWEGSEDGRRWFLGTYMAWSLPGTLRLRMHSFHHHGYGGCFEDGLCEPITSLTSKTHPQCQT